MVGVLSDSHDRLDRLERAARALADRGVETLIHCGDITGADAVEILADFEVHWVFGNCDWNRSALEGAMGRHGHRCHGFRGRLEIDGVRLGFTHGHRGDLFRVMTISGEFDIVLHGHTHLRRDEMIDGTRVVCPGALHHADTPGCVALSLPDGAIDWIDVR